MPASFGTLGVVVAFTSAALGLVLQLVELRRRATGRSVPAWMEGRRLIVLVLAGVLLAVGAMQYALVTHDFALAYVAENNATVTPLLYSITGMWSALAGSILLWALLLSIVSAVFVVIYRRRHDDPVIGWATVVLFATATFFLGLIAGPASPFATTGAVVPTQGAGPDVLLQDNPLVAIHPPLIYSGLVMFTVPFALVIGTLAAGRLGDAWHADTRRWALSAWTLLTVGILLGAWWSYQVLGWGGFWGWDPVENAALLPWLVGTAYVHSVVVEERRGLLRVWNLTLGISVFSLTILATYFTRSGVLQSVHAFSSSTLGGLLLGFLGLVLAAGLGLLAWRGDSLRSPVGIDAPLSKEGAFVANNLLFVGFAVVVLLGTVFPLGYQALRHATVSVGPPYYDSVAIPVALCVLFLMAIAPVLSWRQVDSWVLWRRLRPGAWGGALLVVVLVANGVRGIGTLIAFFLATLAAWSAVRALAFNVRAARTRGVPTWHGLLGRSSGGMVVHLGVVLATVAIVSSTSFATRTTIDLAPGHVGSVGGHTLAYEAVRVIRSPVRTATQLIVRVDGGGLFYPAISKFAGGTVQTPAIDSSLLGDDVYLTFVPVGAHGDVALSVAVEPYVSWLWLGGLVAGLGGALALAPVPRRRRRVRALADPEPIRELETV